MLRRAAANCAGSYRVWADGLGKRTRVWPDVSCADAELTVNLPPNGATLLEPLAADAFPEMLERVSAFFAERPGGGYEVWSLWPTPDLRSEGYESWTIPCMIRDPGGDGRPPPPELELVEVQDEDALGQAEALINEVFEAQAEPGELLGPGLLSDRLRIWVGRVDGRPVSTATAYIGDGFVGIYAVVTTAEARGHGYAEALTWAATLCCPDLPATLQASPMGRPVYERMGYRTVAEFVVWDRDRPARAGDAAPDGVA